MKSLLRREMKKVVTGLLSSFLLFLAIASWRAFDSRTFLFIQILVSTIALLFFLYLISYFFQVSFFREQELLSIFIAFTLVSFLLLNIDRSRSVFLIKWVGQATQVGETSTEQLFVSKDLSLADKKAILQRIEEQGQIRFIDAKENNLSLTWSGQLFFKLATFMADFFNLNGFKRA